MVRMTTEDSGSTTEESDDPLERVLQDLLRRIRDKTNSKTGDAKVQIRPLIKEFIEGRDF
jgi:hypothetical protein